MVNIPFQTKIPDTRLRPYIKIYFGAHDLHAPLVQRIVPTGEMGLCFYRGEAVIYDGFGRRQSCLSGQCTHYQDIISSGNIDIVGVNFTTIGASAFFNLPLHELCDNVIPLDELYDKELTLIEERIASAQDYNACFDLLDNFFLKKLSTTQVDIMNLRRLQRAIAYGQRFVGNAHMEEIASEACLSPRHFSRLFSELAGLTPKEYLRLLRYHKTLHDLKQRNQGTQGKEKNSITEIAWQNGYYDFSHLSSEFRKITGYTPTQLLEISQNDNDSFGWRI